MKSSSTLSLLASLAPNFFQSSHPLASSGLLPLANKHIQVSPEKGSWCLLLSPGSTSDSAFFFFSFVQLFLKNIPLPLPLHPHFPFPFSQNHESSVFSPPIHHTLASTLQTLRWKQPQQPPRCPVCQLSVLVLLALSVPFQNSKNQSFLKVYILGFHGIILFQIYPDSDYSITISYWNFLLLVCLLLKCMCSTRFRPLLTFLHTTCLSRCSFQVAPFDLMIWTLTSVLMTTRANSTVLPSAPSFQLNHLNTMTYIHLKLLFNAGKPKFDIFSPQYFFPGFSPPLLPITFFITMCYWDIKEWVPSLCPCWVDSRPLNALPHHWLDHKIERHRHSEYNWVPGMAEHKGKDVWAPADMAREQPWTQNHHTSDSVLRGKSTMFSIV